jgi:hypothetical protein
LLLGYRLEAPSHLPAPLAAAGAPAAGRLRLAGDRIAKIREDLLGADPDLLGLELELECSHLLPFRLVA